ncbi:ABC transporter ATP-binding protein [Streptomyces albireticuli]|uniref:Multidrug ABC transporter permease n=1 Tax=Streptomyces albireticuli TaxID=1940 RepID=A0A2A2DCY0_9ACTN|nr:ABC transporter ATP-binding protein [Streptomyces albireticuli]MCD9194407.1 ABC transporter ATP-binding protein/permease [Streptomyces albireticuli]PAU50323.1 multidrug ABC transporter permease [Streptomyces albireticuli]
MSERDHGGPGPGGPAPRPAGRGADEADREPVGSAGPAAVLRRTAAAAALVARAAPGALALHLALTLAVGALPVVTAWLTKLLLDALATGAPSGRVIGLGAGLAASGVVLGVVPQIGQYLRAELDRKVGLLAEDRLYTAVEGFAGLGRFENPLFLDRLRLAQGAGGGSPNQAVDGAVGIARAALTIGGFLGSLALLSPLMTGLVLAAAVPTLLSEIAMARRKARTLWEVGPVERRQMFYGELLSSVEAAKEIRLFGIGAFLRGRMLADRRTADAAKRAVDLREAWIQSGLGLLAAGVSGGGLLWAVGAARSGALSPGDVVMFVAAVAGTQGALAGLAGEVARAHRALLMFDHYLAVERAGPDLPVPVRPVPLPALDRGIELRDVWFRYSPEHPWVLRGASLRIRHGEVLALVGLNGAGKSTLVKLVCRFYDPDRGEILWDGVDIRAVDVAELRRRIGAVFQDYMHYDMTAAENIALGDLTALGDRPRVRAAAERAGIHARLAGLPHGYDTLLSRRFFMESDKDDPETGVVLSGGQRQRLALARAFLRDRRDLMILDEPSAGLDAEAEHEIHTALRRHRAGRTSLLISHRLGAVRDADVIAVLEDGRVVERGPHAELIGSGGRYARLFALQAAGYRAEPGGEDGPPFTGESPVGRGHPTAGGAR